MTGLGVIVLDTSRILTFLVEDVSTLVKAGNFWFIAELQHSP
jgi:hypothetical protein